MSRRAHVLLSTTAGLIWSIGLLWFAASFVSLPIFVLMPTIMTAFLAPGLVMVLMVARLALRRLSDDTLIGGQNPDPASAAAIDQRVLINTLEQLVLALCIWPAAAVILADNGPGVIATLGINFAMARLVFWLGYHISPTLKTLGFAVSFYPTVLVALWTVWSMLAYAS